jgi:hypothetical protein
MEGGLITPYVPTGTSEPGFLGFVIIQEEAGIPSRLGLLGWMNV